MYLLQQRLHQPKPLVVGCMSGTSLDGLDIALCQFDGCGLNTRIILHKFSTIPYTSAQRQLLLSIAFQEQVSLKQLSWLHREVGEWHAHMILSSLKQWSVSPMQIAFVANHGQTIYHNPDPDGQKHSTLQIADGDIIAYRTGIPTVCDFRQKHIAAGGQGAPLAPYGDYLLFSHPRRARWLLNIGGIANITYLPAQSALEKVWASDTGPGNTLIDQAMRHYFGKDYDADGATARLGQCHMPMLEALLKHPFFKQALPCSTGPEAFPWQQLESMAALFSATPHDVLCTLTHFTAASISQAIKKHDGSAKEIFVSGGGVHNTFLMECLQQYLPDYSIQSSQELGIHPDAKEAVLFAFLAYECLLGTPKQYPAALSDMPKVRLGKICLPD